MSNIDEYRRNLQREIDAVQPSKEMQAGETIYRFEYGDASKALIWGKTIEQAEQRFAEKFNKPFDPETMTISGLSCGWSYLKGKKRPSPWDTSS